MIDPTLTFWLGFATCAAMVAFIVALSAVRMAGLCSQEEREANGDRPCPGCGAPMPPRSHDHPLHRVPVRAMRTKTTQAFT